MIDEEWKISPRNPSLMVSSHGRVCVIPRRIKMPNGGTRDYESKPRLGYVTRSRKDARHTYLSFTVRGKTYKVHQLICEAFHGPKPFPKAVVIHLDENAHNNRAINLKWGTQKENLNMPWAKLQQSESARRKFGHE